MHDCQIYDLWKHSQSAVMKLVSLPKRGTLKKKKTKWIKAPGNTGQFHVSFYPKPHHSVGCCHCWLQTCLLSLHNPKVGTEHYFGKSVTKKKKWQLELCCCCLFHFKLADSFFSLCSSWQSTSLNVTWIKTCRMSHMIPDARTVYFPQTCLSPITFFQ